MISVTTVTKDKLTETLKSQAKEEGMAVRITLSPQTSNQLMMILDKKREGDEVVMGQNNREILVVEPKLATSLQGIQLDYQETSEGSGFTISKPDSKE